MTSTPQRALVNGHSSRANGLHNSTRQRGSMSRDASSGAGLGAAEEEGGEEDPVHQMLRTRWMEAESKITALFGRNRSGRRLSRQPSVSNDLAADVPTDASAPAKTTAPPKKAARQIDEDDYGDDDDEEEDEDDEDKQSPLKAKGKSSMPTGVPSLAVRSPQPQGAAQINRTTTNTSSEPAKGSEDGLKQLEEGKKAAANAAKRSFQTMFYTLEHDHDAMLEQQRFDELDREVENEISGGANGTSNAQSGSSESGGGGGGTTRGILGSADLGASSLTLKHLIARIDAKRGMISATDQQLRLLISEVRKGRSKWASEDRVGQEELYEAAEKVLMELKAKADVQPFLQRVSKREAPDYFNIIKTPMDIGSMLKKLKSFGYKSKKDFVEDLDLIWSNCLKYNQEPSHPLRKKALQMRKETDKLTPLIPEIVVRDRAEVEAEERRLHSIDADDSDDDDAPIMASRGRKAPKKGGKGLKGGPTSTKRGPSLPANEASSTPVPDTKPALHAGAANFRNDFLRGDSEMQDHSSTGFNTPPPGGTATPAINGVQASGAPGSQVDATETNVFNHSMLGSAQEDIDEEDEEFKAWKDGTLKDRAQAAAERNRLFHGDQLKNLNTDEPALLRTKAMMRRWTRQQKLNQMDKPTTEFGIEQDVDNQEPAAQGETLAEGIEKDEDSTLPDYYNPLSAIPEVDERWKWTTDSEGFVATHNEEWMRMYPKHQFQSTESSLTKKMESNMRQMQETRKIVAKIGVVKQMQVQAQAYQNQFSKYEPQPFVEQDIGPIVVSEDGPIMSPWILRSAFQRSVGKIFYHAGFEDFQPCALDTVTDLASNFFSKLIETFKHYREQEQVDHTSRFTFEEQVLHSLFEHGQDLEALETYVRDDVERLGTKLGVVHDRMRAHLADLLRPALGDNAGADGVGAFNDGSEQFVGGDFAEDLDEDFFGFRELGLAEEFGLESLSVPFHLIQNRMHNAYQAQNQGPISSAGPAFPSPPPYDQICMDNLPTQIGLVQDYFRHKLHNNHFEALVEDEDLPQKQRFPKPRLPPTGKISSPRKRPLREQQQAAKKKRKLEESESKPLQPPIGKLRLEMPDSQDNNIDPDKDGEANGPPSPESITAN